MGGVKPWVKGKSGDWGACYHYQAKDSKLITGRATSTSYKKVWVTGTCHGVLLLLVLVLVECVGVGKPGGKLAGRVAGKV